MIEMSKVPPPRSKTAILRSPFFCRGRRQRGGGRLVDDALDFEAGDAAGILVAWRWASLK